MSYHGDGSTKPLSHLTVAALAEEQQQQPNEQAAVQLTHAPVAVPPALPPSQASSTAEHNYKHRTKNSPPPLIHADSSSTETYASLQHDRNTTSRLHHIDPIILSPPPHLPLPPPQLIPIQQAAHMHLKTEPEPTATHHQQQWQASMPSPSAPWPVPPSALAAMKAGGAVKGEASTSSEGYQASSPTSTATVPSTGEF